MKVDLDNLCRLIEAATKGPWNLASSHVIEQVDVGVRQAVAQSYGHGTLRYANAVLIVSLRNAWPEIEAEIRELRTLVGDAEAAWIVRAREAERERDELRAWAAKQRCPDNDFIDCGTCPPCRERARKTEE